MNIDSNEWMIVWINESIKVKWIMNEETWTITKRLNQWQCLLLISSSPLRTQSLNAHNFTIRCRQEYQVESEKNPPQKTADSKDTLNSHEYHLESLNGIPKHMIVHGSSLEIFRELIHGHCKALSLSFLLIFFPLSRRHTHNTTVIIPIADNPFPPWYFWSH